MGADHHPGPGSLPAPPGQHVTRPQTLWPPSPCFTFLGVRDYLLATLHFFLSTVSGAGSRTATCLRCTCQQGYSIEFPMGDIHVRSVRGEEKRAITLPLNGEQELRPWQLTVMRFAWQLPDIILLTAHSDVESNQLRSSAVILQGSSPRYLLGCWYTSLQAPQWVCRRWLPAFNPLRLKYLEWLLSLAEPN